MSIFLIFFILILLCIFFYINLYVLLYLYNTIFLIGGLSKSRSRKRCISKRTNKRSVSKGRKVNLNLRKRGYIYFCRYIYI